ncbi:MAG: NAD(P)-dependent alcohol dehydrogenase [Bacteroidota bacterium]|nr:NAD(P)-dependent alcohol dehydrogenase [Bacteroidota bacterium]
MKAILWTAYGGPEVLKPGTLPDPEPGEREVVIEVVATTVTAGDCELRSLRLPHFLRLPLRAYFGLRRPRRIRVLGQELAGRVTAVGSAVHGFTAGDSVFGAPGMRLGGYAEYACCSLEKGEAALAHIPHGVGFEEAAAAVVGGLESLHFLRNAGLRAGQSLLVNGAGGSIGSFAVQLGKLYGAEVTGVDSGGKLDMLRGLGADHVIDYAAEDFSRGDRRYDAVLDMVGGKAFGRCLRVLAPGGRYLMANPSLPNLLRGLLLPLHSRKRVLRGSWAQSAEDLRYLAGLLAEGRIRTVIDRRFPLHEAADAHRYAESGEKKGNIVLTVRSVN